MIIYNFIKHLILNIKYTKLLSKVYKDEDLLKKLSQLFGSNFKKDWAGRVYTVINPNIMDGKFDNTTQIFEYNQNGLDNNVYVEKWIMNRFNVISQFIQTNNLFDLLNYKITKLDDYDNYLLVLEPITLRDCIKYTKYFTILFIILIIIGITILCLI